MKDFFTNFIGIGILLCWAVTFLFVTFGCMLASVDWVMRLLGVIG